MTEKIYNCIGSVISVTCEDGYYQGKVSAIDTVTRSITLSRPFKDGLPAGKTIELKGGEIRGVKVLKAGNGPPLTPKASSPPNLTSNSMETPKKKKEPTVKESESNEENGKKPNRISSRTASTSQWVNRPNRQRRNTDIPSSSSSRNSPADTDAVGIAPTPLFRKFEPQVPNPAIVQNNTRYSSKMKKATGPSGIPTLDTTHGRIKKRNTELNMPIDFDLDNDFDFEENLKLFKKDDLDDELFDELPKKSNNFAHYENIIDDPMRCTSWTNTVAKNAYSENGAESDGNADIKNKQPALLKKNGAVRRRSTFREISIGRFVDTVGGLKLPVLNAREKAQLDKELIDLLGESAYSIVLADRILQYIFQVIASGSRPVDRVVLLCVPTSSSSFLERLLLQLSGRGYRVTLYGTSLDKAIPLVEFVENKKDLPNDAQLILDMDILPKSPEMQQWLNERENAVKICVDHAYAKGDSDKVHVLMVCAVLARVLDTLRAPPEPVLGPTNFAKLCAAIYPQARQMSTHLCLLDVGAPFTWFGRPASDALSSLFATSFVAPIDIV